MEHMGTMNNFDYEKLAITKYTWDALRYFDTFHIAGIDGTWTNFHGDFSHFSHSNKSGRLWQPLFSKPMDPSFIPIYII